MMVGVEYDRFLSSLMLYPNPVTTELMIRLGDEIAAEVQDQISYEIQDLPGRIVARGFLPDHLNNIPVQHLQQGAYFLSISYKTTRITSYKFIKAE